MKITMLTAALILTAGLVAGLAQEQRTMEYHRVQTMSQSASGPAETKFFTAAGPNTFFFESSEMAFDSAVVKGAPYSADATTETTQTLADGNRIHQSTKSALYRDSEGRTRREQTLGEIGPLTTGEPIQTIVISDPVAGATYMLNSREKIAHKMPGRGEMFGRIGKMATIKKDAEAGALTRVEGPVEQRFEVRVARGAPMDSKNVKKESLGTQMIEGVAAEGTRTTMTIPAGAMGNERPMDIVTESWYSNQLHTTVMTKTTDPRAGETVYSLKNIRLAEPSPSLFTVPSDYSVQ